MSDAKRSICVVGATGTIGQAVVAALVRHGFTVTAVARASADKPLEGAVVRVDVRDAAAVAQAFADARFAVVVSCLASRTGVAADAEAVDYRAQMNVLDAAQRAEVGHFILLSAICVQKPKLAFQRAKLRFEAALAGSGMRYSIVRPTAFFKSLSGQIDRVRKGKPYLLFGDGRLTACKPISDRDLGEYIVDCIDDPARWNRILPIGGPGPAITPREQGEALFAMVGCKPRFRSISPRLLITVARLLGAIPGMKAKAEYARIGHYYATESMLVWDSERGTYDAAATPETGSDSLFDHYRAMLDQAGKEKRPGL